MSKWVSLKLEDIVDSANTGLDAIRRAPIVEEDTGIKCLRIQDVSQSKPFESWGNSKVNAKDYERAQLRTDDLIMARTCSPGIVYHVRHDLRAVFNNGLARIRPDTSKTTSLFLYYVFNSPEFIGHIYGISGGTSVQLNMKLGDLLSYEMTIPSLEEQKAIAAVLSSLDDKIDLLHRQNQTLEAMAATLFRQWFVEEAQEDWEEYLVSDFAEHIKINVVPANLKSELFHHYSMPAFDDGKRPTVELGSEILSNKYKVAAHSILVSKLNPRVPRIWPIGDLKNENAICSTEFQVFKPKNEKLYGYLYFLLCSNDAVDALTMAASGTSGSHQRVRPEDILNIRTSLPSIERAEEYSRFVMPGIDKARSNLVQIQILEKLRDNLLPKLMSGEVRVEV